MNMIIKFVLVLISIMLIIPFIALALVGLVALLDTDTFLIIMAELIGV